LIFQKGILLIKISKHYNVERSKIIAICYVGILLRDEFLEMNMAVFEMNM